MARKPRPPQLPLQLDLLAPDPSLRWRDGALLDYLGETVRLRLASDRKEAELAAGLLHLPLPPEAGARQIQDAAEAWLRGQALIFFRATIGRQAERLGRSAPACALSFAARASWAQGDAGTLRCNWRLIEQPPVVIEQVLAQAVASLPVEAASGDLFAA